MYLISLASFISKHFVLVKTKNWTKFEVTFFTCNSYLSIQKKTGEEPTELSKYVVPF